MLKELELDDITLDIEFSNIHRDEYALGFSSKNAENEFSIELDRHLDFYDLNKRQTNIVNFLNHLNISRQSLYLFWLFCDLLLKFKLTETSCAPPEFIPSPATVRS